MSLGPTVSVHEAHRVADPVLSVVAQGHDLVLLPRVVEHLGNKAVLLVVLEVRLACRHDVSAREHVDHVHVLLVDRSRTRVAHLTQCWHGGLSCHTRPVGRTDQFQFRLTVDDVPSAVGAIDDQTVLVVANWALRALVGDRAVVGSLADRLVVPSDRERFRRLCEIGASSRGPAIIRVSLPDGLARSVAVTLDPRSAETPHLRTLWFAPQHQANDMLSRLVLQGHDAMGDGVVIGDGKRLLHANSSACAIYGYELGDLLALTSLFERLRPDEQERITNEIAREIEAGRPPPDRYEAVIVQPSGTTLDVELSVKAIVGERDVRTISIVRAITERRRIQAELLERAWHDPLTGLANRSLLLDRLRQVTARLQREPRLAALFFFDLDDFKKVNDRLGHAAGDAVLTEVASRLRHGLRDGDTAARIGGDEFVVLCYQVKDREAAHRLAERLSTAVAAPVQFGATTILTRASVGVIVFGDDAVSPEELLSAADARMYDAKRATSSSATTTVAPLSTPDGAARAED